jgi:hypothetical protein
MPGDYRLEFSYPKAIAPTRSQGTRGDHMNIRTSILAIGVTLALVAPAAASARPVTNQAGDTYFVTEHSQHAAQALNALNARWNAEAAAYRASQAQLAADRAIKAVDDRWNAQAKAYKARLADDLALKALNARLNAQGMR